MSAARLKTITKAALATAGVALTAVALTAGSASADHRGHGARHHHPPAVVTHHGKPVKVARAHDHHFDVYDYDRRGRVVHRHSGYGRHVHLKPHDHSPHGGRRAHRQHHHDHHDATALKRKKKVKTFLKVLGGLAAH